MENVIKLLQENPNGAFATVDEGKPQVRPWQFQFAEDGRLYFGTGNTKEVFKQLQATPYAAFTSTSSDMITVRVRGAVTFIDDKGLKQRMLDRNEVLKQIYPSGDDPIFEVFYIEHGEAIISDFSGNPPQKINF